MTKESSEEEVVCAPFLEDYDIGPLITVLLGLLYLVAIVFGVG